MVVRADRRAPSSRAAAGERGGFAFFVEHGLEALARADTIVVPGWHGEPSAEPSSRRARGARRGARLVSICSGVFLLAATGLLDGAKAATHWRYAATRWPSAIPA